METPKSVVNNTFYDDLNEAWSCGDNHPIALLRQENALRNPWICQLIEDHFKKNIKVLDVGCGGGLLTSYLDHHGHIVSGIDLSKGSIGFAKSQDKKGSIDYKIASADHLPYENETFDVVCAMDLLEHVDCYETVIKEATRVLKKGGLIFFHTFNRNPLSYIIIIKGVEWFVKNTPKDLHVYEYFIKPRELKATLNKNGYEHIHMQGLVPDPKTKSFWKMLAKKTVDEKFRFKFSKSLMTGYVGYGIKSP